LVSAAIGEFEVVAGIEEGKNGLLIAQPVSCEIVDGKLEDL